MGFGQGACVAASKQLRASPSRRRARVLLRTPAPSQPRPMPMARARREPGVSSTRASSLRLMRGARHTVWTQVKGLDRFSALRSLCVHGHTLSAIGGLERCTALTDLNLSSNHLSHISGLNTLTALQYLNLSRNRLTVVTGAFEWRQVRRGAHPRYPALTAVRSPSAPTSGAVSPCTIRPDLHPEPTRALRPLTQPRLPPPRGMLGSASVPAGYTGARLTRRTLVSTSCLPGQALLTPLTPL
jgi:hypothetical protein